MMPTCEAGLVRVIPPIYITDDILISSNIPETDYDLYDATATYAVGQRCIVAENNIHRIYENQIDGNIGKYPPLNITEWQDIGPTNRWKLFDLYSETVSQNPDSIVIELLTTNRIDSLVLLAVSAVSVGVTVTHPTEGVLFNQNYSMHDSTGISGLYEWLFRRHRKKTALTVLNLPPYTGMTIRIDIQAEGGIAECGSLIVGYQEVIGQMQYGYGFGLSDYSKKDINEAGIISIKKRGYSAQPEFGLQLELNDFDRVAKIAANYRSTPAIWIGGTQHEMMTAFGFYKDFRVTVPHSAWAECTLQIEGLI